jgi:hypothetical protein
MTRRSELIFSSERRRERMRQIERKIKTNRRRKSLEKS